MSEISQLEIAYEDNRGIILDIFESDPKDHAALITFTKGSQRANHFHKKSIQSTFLISGTLIMRSAKVDETGQFLESVKEDIIQPHMLVTHKPYEAHAFEAASNAKILAFASGLRGGKNYEKDVYRLIQNMFEM